MSTKASCASMTSVTAHVGAERSGNGAQRAENGVNGSGAWSRRPRSGQRVSQK